MRRITFLTVAAISTVVFASQAAREPLSNRAAIEKAVLKVHAQMAQAEKELDAERFFGYILDFDNGLIMQDGIVFGTSQEALDAVKIGFERVAQIQRTYERTEVTVLSLEAALLTAKGTSTVTLVDGRSFNNPFAASSVFVLRDGQWKLLHGHYSLPNPR
jgi:hypothetical protein